MTTKTLIFMNIAYLNGNFDGKLVKNLADGSVGRRGDLRSGHIRIPLHIFPLKLFAKYRNLPVYRAVAKCSSSLTPRKQQKKLSHDETIYTVITYLRGIIL